MGAGAAARTEPLVFAVLAHADRDCLGDLVGNLRSLAPGSAIVVFNGGTDASLTDGLEVETCPYSRPLVHHWLAAFHGLVMQWLGEHGRAFEFLVTLDSDMLLLKPGLLSFLRDTMSGTAYMGPHFGEVLPGTPWAPGRRFHRKWAGPWQERFELAHPYRAFNPGQVFRREYVDAFNGWQRRKELMQAIERTRLDALEEIVWPTLAMTLGLGARDNPGGRSLQLRRHSPSEIASYLRDPATFLLHRVGMELDAPEREIMRSVLAGQSLDIAAMPYTYDTSPQQPSWPRAAAGRAKDAYQAVMPASHKGRT